MVKHRGDDICGVLLLDKPTGRSSNFYLQRVKYLFNAKKAGHTGSLDPLATGLLPICFGKATCLSEYFLHSDKSYEAVIQLGIITDSHDCDGQIVEHREVAVSEEQFSIALQSFQGEIKQTPPMVSALKHKGQPLYKLALKGKEVERKARKMTVYALSGELLENNQARLNVHCSSGFYVRQLAADLGEKLGCGAHIIALRRTTSKHLNVDDAISFDQLEKDVSNLKSFSQIDYVQAKKDYIQRRLLPADGLLSSLPAIYTDTINAEHASHGRRVEVNAVSLDQNLNKAMEEENLRTILAQQHFRLYQSIAQKVHFLGIAELKEDGKIKVRRLFNSFKST